MADIGRMVWPGGRENQGLIPGLRTQRMLTFKACTPEPVTTISTEDRDPRPEPSDSNRPDPDEDRAGRHFQNRMCSLFQGF